MKQENISKTKKFSTLHLLAAITVMLALAYYGWSLLLQDYSKVTYNHISRAFTGTVNIAFGNLTFIKGPHAIAFASDSCEQKDTAAGYKCLLLHPFGADFYKTCDWWKFEDCAHMGGDSLLAKDEKLREAVIQVLQNPCQYLPSEEEIFQQAEAAEPMRRTSVKQFIEHRRILGCDDNKKRTISLYLAIPEIPTIKIKTLVGE